MVSPEALTDGSLNHKHAVNSSIDTADTNSQVDNSNTNIRITESVKQPSYLNLACCISGYTNLTTYNSKQREGFRSRDISPARITGVSPHAADDANNPAVFTSTCGNFLSPQPRYLTDMDHRKKSGDNMWNGNGNSVSPAANGKVSTSTYTSFSTSSSASTVSGTSSSYRSETRREVSSTFHTDSLTSHSREVPMPASSFIVQRVERLYGPGALAQGFYARRSLGSSPRPLAQKETAEKEVGKDLSESPLPVLKLLTPAFRAQLTLAKRKSSSPVTSPNRIADVTDGAVERVIPVIDLASDEKDKLNKNKIEERETVVVNKPIEKNGHYYLKMVLDESARLEGLAAELEQYISSVPEYMEGRLRAAAGKARLLANQKLAQFKGLCQKNINQDLTENFPTTCEDLAGFWDMVTIQINNVHAEFEQLDKLRKAGWPEQDTIEKNGKKANKEVMSNGNSSVPSRAKSAPVVVKDNAASKARDEARKKLLAERRKAMRQNQPNSSEDVVIV